MHELMLVVPSVVIGLSFILIGVTGYIGSVTKSGYFLSLSMILAGAMPMLSPLLVDWIKAGLGWLTMGLGLYTIKLILVDKNPIILENAIKRKGAKNDI
jgi:hypothetical protein